tara:strand:- start:841 stop:1452 length:612 start_codon:yes stop_codon:yes gene_type:complete
MKIKYYEDDLPSNLKLGESVAIDTETMGLNPLRDRLCLIQISKGDGVCHLVKINDTKTKPQNVIKLLKDKKIIKIFHYARFDLGILQYTYKINITNIYCTKIASKLARTFTDKHGYKDLCFELLNKRINKNEQTSDWGSKKLTIKQKKYAATDVLYLHDLKDKLDEILYREKRLNISQACFNFLVHRVNLDLNGWEDLDIFKH